MLSNTRQSCSMAPLAFLGVLSALALILYSPSVPAKPVVTWAVEALEEEIPAGETKTVDVSFTVSEDLDDIEVRITPGLLPYVSVEPSAFDQVPAGVTINVKVTFSNSFLNEGGIYDGTIQLRERRGVVASPLPVNVDAWKEEELGQTGIYFSYPSGWYNFSTDTNVQLFSEIIEPDELNKPQIIITIDSGALEVDSIFDSLEGYAIDEWFGTYDSAESITINGYNALFIHDLAGPVVRTPALATFIEVPPAVLIITAVDASPEDYFQFLESLLIP